MPPPQHPCSVWGCKQNGTTFYKSLRVCVHHWTFLTAKDARCPGKKGAAVR